MLPAKLSRGFVEVFTDDSSCYVIPSFLQRLRLMWMFRNFSVLSEQVLSASQQQLVSSLCSKPQLLPSLAAAERDGKVLIGRLETTAVAPAQPSAERRQSTRSSVEFEVRYGVGRRLLEGQGWNYSAAGLAFSGPRQFPVGVELELRYRLPAPADATPASGRHARPKARWIRTRALVRRRDGELMGVEFLGAAER
jgi:hypothetical protein